MRISDPQTAKAAGDRRLEADRTVHASCVSVEGRGLLILGASGAGKSSLALSLMAFGADLVADDLVRLTRDPLGRPLAVSANPDVQGIEARGYGILPARCQGPVDLRAVLDMEVVETERFPHNRREIEVCGAFLPLLFRLEGPQFAAAVMVYLRGLD